MRNLDAFLNIASNACLIARLFVQSLVMSDPHHNYEKKAGSLRSNLDGGLPLGILCCYGWHTGASCFLHRLSGNRRDSGGTFDFWRTNTASGEWAAEPVFSSVSMTRNESKRCTAQWVTGGNWDSRQRERERDETERNGTERNGTERNGTEQNRTEQNGLLMWVPRLCDRALFVSTMESGFIASSGQWKGSKQASRQRSGAERIGKVKVSFVIAYWIRFLF